MTENVMTNGSKISFDKHFKNMVHSPNLLAFTIKQMIPEFRDKDLETIKEHLDINPDSHRVISEDTEIPLFNGEKIILDSLFRIRTDDNREIALEINLEGQFKRNTGYPIGARAMHYACTLLSTEKGRVFSDSHFDRMVKVYSIWFMIKPYLSEQNTIRRFGMRELMSDGKTIPAPEYDYLEIIMVYMGEHSQLADEDLINVFNLVFREDLDPQERLKRLQEDYNILPDSCLIDSMEETVKSYAEELREQAIEDAQIDVQAKNIVFMVKRNNISIDEAMSNLSIDPSLEKDIRYLAEKELQKGD
ncbi:MAG: hypothetical protein IKP04_07615 [Candidatus Methanomethylophilaceae archaeon]|nr:hypothetical protein [Candidatus Methanomethylophilaceae archaeon]